MNKNSMNMQFKTKVNGIPCYCRVDHYSPGAPAKLGGAMEDTEEALNEEFEYTMLDSRHIIAPWITKQMIEEDHNRILEEFYVTLLEFKHYIEEPYEPNYKYGNLYT